MPSKINIMNKHILIVEDDIVFCKLLTTYLKSQQFSAQTAQTVVAAKGLIQNQTFHVAIIDQRLPDGNGLEIIQLLKAEKPEVKIILMSRYLDEDLKAQGTACGVDAFIKKPIKPADLLPLLH